MLMSRFVDVATLSVTHSATFHFPRSLDQEYDKQPGIPGMFNAYLFLTSHLISLRQRIMIIYPAPAASARRTSVARRRIPFPPCKSRRTACSEESGGSRARGNSLWGPGLCDVIFVECLRFEPSLHFVADTMRFTSCRRRCATSMVPCKFPLMRNLQLPSELHS